MEIGGCYNNYYNANTIIQRAINNAVEYAMDDAYRADYVSKVKTATMLTTFEQNLADGMPDGWDYDLDVTGTDEPPYINVTGTVTFPTLFSQYGFDDVTFDIDILVQNVRLD